MEGRELRRTLTLSEQLAGPDPALRDFLRIPDDDDDDDDGNDDTDDSAAAGSRSRTLIDMIRNGSSGDANSNGINWKPLKDRLRLRSAGNAWSSSGPTGETADSAPPACGPTTLRPAPTLSRTMSLSASSVRPSLSLRAPSSRVATVVQDEHESQSNDEQGRAPPDDSNNNEEEEEEEMPVRMSLMALLEQTDSQWNSGGDGRREAAGDEGEEEENEEDVEGGNGSGMLYVCCVCMVRHKGAAFIPCGHTFCRLCSRELWVSRGNCPLCNGFIQEILDIF